MITNTVTSTVTNRITAGFKYGYQTRRRRYFYIMIALCTLLLVLCTLMMMIGKTVYTPVEIMEALILGQSHPAHFAIVTLRLPRMLGALFSGLAFGMAGSAFQALLKNPLASPDMIGINAGASAAAVYGILVMGWSGLLLSGFAVTAGLLTALIIYGLAATDRQGNNYSHSRLILIGISIQAALNALISWLLMSASEYDIQNAMRWLGGSLHSLRLVSIIPLTIIVLITGLTLLSLKRHLDLLTLGDAVATALGLNAHGSRMAILACAVTLVSFASALTGPIAFVPFLAGPIARGFVGKGNNDPLAAGLVGALIVVTSDLIGQQVLPVKLPVGVITGLVGAPYLIWLILKHHRHGGLT